MLSQEELDSSDTTPLWRLREAIMQTCDEVNPDPINRAFDKLFSDNKPTMEKSQSTLWEGMKKQGAKPDVKPSIEVTEKAIQNVQKEVRQELKTVMDKIGVLIQKNRPYFDRLEKLFEEKYNKLAHSSEKTPLVGNQT
eukprot:UN0859